MEMETKSNIFSWDIFKSYVIFSKSKLLIFMTKINPNNGNERKSNIFPMGRIQTSNFPFFIVRKILKYLNDFYNWHFSISLQKLVRKCKKKENQMGNMYI